MPFFFPANVSPVAFLENLWAPQRGFRGLVENLTALLCCLRLPEVECQVKSSLWGEQEINVLYHSTVFIDHTQDVLA